MPRSVRLGGEHYLQFVDLVDKALAGDRQRNGDFLDRVRGVEVILAGEASSSGALRWLDEVRSRYRNG